MIANSSRKSMHAWLVAFGVLLIAIGAALGVWWPYVFAEKAMWHDWARVAQGMFHLAHEQLHQLHQFPTWSDSFFSGFPFTRSLNGLYNPIAILLIWLYDAYTAYHAVMVVNFILGFLAAYAFGRLITLSRAASIVLAFGHTYTQWNMEWAHNNMYSNLILIPPLLFGAIYISRERFSWLWMLLAIYGATTGFISATPDSAAWVVMMAGVFALYLDVKSVGFRRFSDILAYRSSFAFCGIMAVSVLISLFFLLPTMQMIPLTFRSGGLSLAQAAAQGLSVGDIFTLFYPHFPSLPYFLHSQPWIYVGLVTLLGAVFGIAARKSHAVGSIFTWMFGYVILANFKYSPFYGVVLLIPGLNTQRGPFRTLFIAYFLLATLAGIGIHAMQKGGIGDSLKQRLSVITRWVFAVVGTGWIAMAALLHTRAGQYVQDMGLRLLRSVRGNPKSLEHYQVVWSGFSKQIADVVSFADIRFVATLSVIFAISFILWQWERGKLNPTRMAMLFAILAGLNMVIMWQHYHVEVPRKLVTEKSSTTEFLDSIKPKEPFRIFTASSDGLAPSEYPHEPYMRLANAALIPNANILFDYQSISGNEGMRPRRINQLLASFGSTYAPFPGIAPDVSSFTPEARKGLLTKYRGTLSMMNVRYIITTYQLASPWKHLYEMYLADTDTTVRVYENTDVLPRAYFPKHVTFLPINEVANLSTVLHNKDFSDISFIECMECGPQKETEVVSEATADIISYRDDGFLRIRTRTNEPRWLVASQHNLPGWRITIDGEEVKSQLANYLYHGVRVPAGEHIVEMEFPGLWRQFTRTLQYFLFDPSRALEKDLPRWPRGLSFS